MPMMLLLRLIIAMAITHWHRAQVFVSLRTAAATPGRGRRQIARALMKPRLPEPFVS